VLGTDADEVVRCCREAAARQRRSRRAWRFVDAFNAHMLSLFNERQSVAGQIGTADRTVRGESKESATELLTPAGFIVAGDRYYREI